MTFTDLLDHLGIPWVTDHHHVRAGRIGFDCVYCSPGTSKWKMSWTGYGWKAGCWSCGWFPLLDILADLTNRSKGELYPLIKDAVGGTWQPTTKIKPRGKLTLPKGTGPLLRPHREYLTKRGLDPDEAAEVWGMQATGFASDLPWRLVIPITVRGETVSWTTRALYDKGLRYINAKPDQERLSAKQTLFGLDFVRHACIVCEGYLDAIACGPGGIGTGGLSISREQIRLLARIPLRVIVMDAEPIAQQRARKLCDELSCFPGRTVRIELQTGKDPIRASKEELTELRQKYLK